MEILKKIISSRVTLEILAAVVAVCVLVGFIEEIGSYFGMTSKAAFEHAIAIKDANITQKAKDAQAAMTRAATAEQVAATAEQRVRDKTAQIVQVNKTLDAIIKARPTTAEVIDADTKLATTDQGVCKLLERVLHIPCARVRMVTACGG